MRTLDLHRDVGAYALGVLDAADAFRFEDHLMVCPQCTLLLADFGGVKAQLDNYARQTPAEVAPFIVADPALLTGLLDRTAAGQRRSRRRWLALVAVAAMLVLGGPLAVLGTASDRVTGPGAVGAGAVPGVSPGGEVAARWTASDSTTGTSAVVTTAGTDWGTDIGLELDRPGVAEVCSLVVVGVDGSETTVMTWASRAEDSETMITKGGAALAPEEIDHFEIRAADGRVLVTING
ncbi:MULTISPECIES: zf-HC2 domain-containing protein [unclassified Streptomyces]|uniref:zf-HC2 domain-containing protein n=1 Tax=unclassified Streptomyces TaxID=2593676 RepID=UPI00380E0037